MNKKFTFVFIFSLLLSFSQLSSATTYYVDASKTDNSGSGTSWATAKKDIQNAIDLATAGDQVWIKAGVYYPNASPNMTASTTVTATSLLTSRDYYIQLKDGVSIFGGFAGTETALSQRNISDNPTYIDGDIGVPGDKTDNCYHLMIYMGTYSTTGVTVDGLVLRNANATRLAASTDYSEETYVFANGFDNPIQRRISGGLYVGRGLNNTISNIVFENNECEVFGAALYLYGISGLFCTYNVINCYFVNNRMSASTYGAMCSDGGNVNCYNTVFYNNSCGSNGGDGVALNLIRTKNKIVNCSFANNQSYTGSALNIQSTETTEIYNSIFYGNTRSNPSFAATSGYDFRKFFAGPVPIIKNCSLMHPSANYTAANYTEMDATSSGNLYEQAPSFSDINNLKGADGKYFTADDGLALTASSTLKNAGLNSLLPSILTVDITYAPRILATTVDMGAYEIDGALSVSDTILAQIGNEGDAPNTVPSVVTTTQLGQILPAITGVLAANQAAYQAYIDANPSLFSAPATASEVQAMVTAVNAQVAAVVVSNAILAQIGSEADDPSDNPMVPSVVTTTQLGQILPAITGVIAANESAYQAYIDANPGLFGAPATAAEVQAMVTEVNAAVVASNAVLTQIGNEADSPNVVFSIVTTTQLGVILPAITDVIAANEFFYQGYIEDNPGLFGSPATAAEVQAMITAVNAQVVTSNEVLTQIGNEGDSPNTLPSVVTIAQLGQILLITEPIIAANLAGYQAYIDAYPNLFSSPATPGEVDVMLYDVNYSYEILAQIGNEADSPNTVASAVTNTQLGAILPAITGIAAANQAAYQAYIDANPDLFSAPATAAEVQAMVAAVNAQVAAVAASNAVLTQIGNEGDSPNTVASVVTIAQLGVILPAITGIVAANEVAYQAYIDANPSLFSAPATTAEVQAMVTAVNAQVAAVEASNAVLIQIGNEGDAPNTVTSTVTIAQLGTILPAITGIVAANEAAYQAYIDANPDLFSAPATAAEVQAMVTAVNAALSTNDFDIIDTVIYPNPSNAIFNIEIDVNASIELYDAIGKRLKSDKITMGTTALNLSNYSDGVYFLKITNQMNQTKTVRLIKK
jgi:hypothetical protein